MEYETWRAISGMVGLIIFIILFAGVLVYALWPKNKAKFDHAARLPLEDDTSDDNTLAHGGCRG